MRDGYIKVGAGTPRIKVADCAHNAAAVLTLLQEAAREGAQVLCLPELCLTGYTCADLFLQDTLLKAAEAGLASILEGSRDLDLVAAVGLPVRFHNKLYNCAAVIQKGQLLGLVPKTHIPNYGEFYEARWFTSGGDLAEGGCHIAFAGQEGVPFSPGQLFRCEEAPNLVIGVEICEDLWAVTPPSNRLAAEGATVILNLSASDEVVGKADYRRSLVTGQSARLVCGYVYADAGEGESTTDLVFAGHDLIAENGALVAQNRFAAGLTVSELNVDKLAYERRRMNTYPAGDRSICPTPFHLPLGETTLTRPVARSPFVPEEDGQRGARCGEILTIAALGLKKRLEHTGARTAVIGLSGGLDSTLALLITARAFDMLGWDHQGITAVTMPCFGTTKRTRSNAEILAAELGCNFRTVDITAAVNLHFADVGQNPDTHDVTYENSQARERTQVLMDMANQTGGLVIGTGDLSELALGWCTYNGDHMSMYAVNASIPKTLVRHLVAYVAREKGGRLGAALKDVLDTPVSPELLPPKDGAISQKTEDLVGPYELHDFFLYYILRWGFPPRKVYRLARYAFEGAYPEETILKWLKTFYRRFFSQQFKRSCSPDGPKVGTVTLSPRGDWRMPSDAVAALWLEELEGL